MRIIFKNVIGSESTLMQSVLAIIFSNSFTHCQAEQNTLESIFKVEQLHLLTCLGHSDVVFILYVLDLLKSDI